MIVLNLLGVISYHHFVTALGFPTQEVIHISIFIVFKLPLFVFFCLFVLLQLPLISFLSLNSYTDTDVGDVFAFLATTKMLFAPCLLLRCYLSGKCICAQV